MKLSLSAQSAKECRQEFERTYAWPGPAQRYAELYSEMLGRAGKS